MAGAVTVHVVPPKGGAISVNDAIEVAPHLAQLLNPNKRFGTVTHIEADADGRGFLVVVREARTLDVPRPRCLDVGQ